MSEWTGIGSGEPIRVVMVDDHEMLLDSLQQLLNQESDITVVAGVGTVEAALVAIEEHRPDIVVLDYHLPDGDGATAAGRIAEKWPDMRVIMLSGSDQDQPALEAARAGCAGYLEKTKAARELVHMVRRVHAGAHELPAELLDRLPRPAELVNHYQPIVNLHTSEIVGFEALVRWSHPTRGLVPPGEFIALAEQTSVIIDIGDHVRNEAYRQAAEWNHQFATSPARFMSINLSGRELQHSSELPARIERELADAGLDPNALMIEVTETVLVSDIEDNTRILGQLKDLGVRIALDDFGTGYSSLDYLRRFPIDVIKLDKSFTDELPHGTRGLRLLDAVGRLATDMGAVPEAEGIETEDQAICLRGLGWQLGQGYYYSRPIDGASMTTRLSS